MNKGHTIAPHGHEIKIQKCDYWNELKNSNKTMYFESQLILEREIVCDAEITLIARKIVVGVNTSRSHHICNVDKELNVS